MGMDNYLALMSGFSQQRNLMACGKGMNATTFFFFSLIDTNLVRCAWNCLFYSLIYESGLKQRLLRYASSALLFTEKGVDPFLVSWNR